MGVSVQFWSVLGGFVPLLSLSAQSKVFLSRLLGAFFFARLGRFCLNIYPFVYSFCLSVQLVLWLLFFFSFGLCSCGSFCLVLYLSVNFSVFHCKFGSCCAVLGLSVP